MTTEAEKQKPRNPDEIRIRELKFRGSIDLGIEQQVARINNFAKSDKAVYEIHFLPRINKYRVVEYRGNGEENQPRAGTPASVMLVPGDWCVGILDAPEASSAKLGT